MMIIIVIILLMYHYIWWLYLANGNTGDQIATIVSSIIAAITMLYITIS